MPRPRLYFLLAKQSLLEPVSGDRINEIGLIRALSASFDVYYNGVLADPTAEAFGRTDGVIVEPKPGEYDLVYVRANRDVFLNAPSPKLWFASPYDAECFAAADAIVCMTQPWKERLQTYSADSFDYFDRMYPVDMVAPKRCILFPQVVKFLPSEGELRSLRSKSVSLDVPRNKSSWIARFTAALRRGNDSADHRLVLRHFGPIRDSNYPHHLVRALADTGISRRIRAQSIGAGSKKEMPRSVEVFGRMDQGMALALLAQTPAIWYHQQRAGNFAGSLKVLEAMAMGVPILAPRWDARVCELGEDYPFFWTPSAGDDFATAGQDAFEGALHKLLDASPQHLRTVSDQLRTRVQAHTVEAVSKRLATELASYL